eukprot:1145040-Pelagomonas_calceolata.AAC.3
MLRGALGLLSHAQTCQRKLLESQIHKRTWDAQDGHFAKRGGAVARAQGARLRQDGRGQGLQQALILSATVLQANSISCVNGHWSDQQAGQGLQQALIP